MTLLKLLKATVELEKDALSLRVELKLFDIYTGESWTGEAVSLSYDENLNSLVIVGNLHG